MFLLTLLLCAPLAAARTVLVTGATGQTGAPAYKWLKQQQGVEVRALVRNADKARKLLGCQKCDQSEGIYVGDVTKPETLVAAVANVDALLIATGAVAHAKEVILDGTRNQIAAYAMAPGPALHDKHIVKVSTMLTTHRFNPIDILAGGAFFYHGVADQDISVAGIPFTIVQPCGLGDATKAAHSDRLMVSHDDMPFTEGKESSIFREDVAHVTAWATTHPNETKWLKFDLCADSSQKPEGTEEQEFHRVFKEGMMPWDPRAKSSIEPIVV